MGCIQLPADAFGQFLIRKFGNIKTFQGSLFVTGVCMLAILVIPKHFIWAKYIFVGVAIILSSLFSAICFILANHLANIKRTSNELPNDIKVVKITKLVILNFFVK